jgi:branched-chain amino acid transport system substrate-binding protein
MVDALLEVVRDGFPGVRRLAVLTRTDPVPAALGTELARVARKQGLETVFLEKYATPALEHTPLLASIKSAAPHWIVVIGNAPDFPLLRRQMSDLGVAARVITMLPPSGQPDIALTLGAAAERITSAASWHRAVRYKGQDVFGTTEAFNQLFQAKYGSDADDIEASAAACGALLQLAMERARTTDPRQVRDALAATNAMTFYGPVQFGSTGQISSLLPAVFQVQEGRVAILFPPSIKQADLRLPDR